MGEPLLLNITAVSQNFKLKLLYISLLTINIAANAQCKIKGYFTSKIKYFDIGALIHTTEICLSKTILMKNNKNYFPFYLDVDLVAQHSSSEDHGFGSSLELFAHVE